MAFYIFTKKKFVLFSTLIILGVLVWLLYLQNENRRQVLHEQQAVVHSELQLRERLLKSRLQGGFRHVEFLARTPPVNGIIRAQAHQGFDPVGKSDLQTWRQRLTTIFYAYIESNPHIVQVRYIGAADGGRELVRVDRLKEGITVVAEKDLQQKGQRDYFQAVSRLTDTQIHLSAINLNREHGAIEQPPWPTYRIAKPVFDEQNRFFGTVIVNFEALPLLTAVKESGVENLLVFLMNADGNYLIHPQAEQAFAWEYGPAPSWFTDTSLRSDRPLNNFILATHKTLGAQYRLLSRIVTFNHTEPVVSFQLVVGVTEQSIKQAVFHRQLLSAIVDVALGAVIITLLYLCLRLVEKNREETHLRAQIDALFHGTSNAILSLDLKGRVLAWNPAALTLFQCSELDIQRANIQDLLPFQADTGLDPDVYQRVLTDGHNCTQELQLKRDDNDAVDVSLSLSPVSDAINLTVGMSLIFHDITDAKRLQRNLEAVNARLEESNAEMEKFIYSVSHDLKAPLVTIGSFTEKIIQSGGDQLNEKNRHRLNRILVNTQNMSEILYELLQLSRIAREEIQIEKYKLSRCVYFACEALHQNILEGHASISTEVGEMEIYCNGKLLTNCIQNLIANAIQYRHPDREPRIVITSRIQNTIARISVSDNGLGIAPAYHDQIFKIFERLDVGEGNGVGLAIVKSIVEKHHGWVELESEPDLGSTFTLCIPQGGYAA